MEVIAKAGFRRNCRNVKIVSWRYVCTRKSVR